MFECEKHKFTGGTFEVPLIVPKCFICEHDRFEAIERQARQLLLLLDALDAWRSLEDLRAKSREVEEAMSKLRQDLKPLPILQGFHNNE